ncbi:large subunit ribosomal protein L35e [Pancytospora epiphaga]|nr:large subunit ribosomal protein L35e [Pancytospora epiphaga]
MADKICSSELRQSNTVQLKEKLEGLRMDYQALLQQKHSSSVGPDEIRTARKNIARCMQVIREKDLENLVEEYKGKRFLPKKLRPKLNKKLRSMLTKKQTNKKVRRARIHAAQFPMKIFSFNN